MQSVGISEAGIHGEIKEHGKDQGYHWRCEEVASCDFLTTPMTQPP
jgi:hypothetical protein